MATAIERRIQALEKRLQARHSSGGIWRPPMQSATELLQFFKDRPEPPPCNRRGGWLVIPTIPRDVWLELAAAQWSVEHELPDLDESNEEHETDSIQKTPV